MQFCEIRNQFSIWYAAVRGHEDQQERIDKPTCISKFFREKISNRPSKAGDGSAARYYYRNTLPACFISRTEGKSCVT